MELFTLLFGDLLALVYHCFDRIVIYGYLSALSLPEQVVHFFRNVVSVPRPLSWAAGFSYSPAALSRANLQSAARSAQVVDRSP